MKHSKTAILFILLCKMIAVYATDYSLQSGNSIIRVSKTGEKDFELTLECGENIYQSINHPYSITIEVNGSTLNGNYAKINKIADNLICTANITSQHGSVFEVTDIISKDKSDFFKIERKIKITNVNSADNYFNSYLGFIYKNSTTMNDHDYFVPGIWYRDNRFLTPRALASDYSDNYFYFREDRLPLPIIAAREKSTGISMVLMHTDAYPATFYGENGLGRIVDERMQFGSLGFVRTNDLSVQFVFPGLEGEKTYVGRLPGKTKYIAYRSHPVKQQVEHAYNLVIGITKTTDFASLVESSWKQGWENYNPPVHKMDVKDAYHASIEVLDAYLENINGAPGWPFSIYLPNGVARAYNYQMGFIGAQFSNAYFLMRYGLENKNPGYVKRASEVIDFWVSNSMTKAGLPKTWTDAYIDRKHTWRDYETYMRSTAGGMEGMMSAWSIMKKHNVNKPAWLNYCRTYADWLVKNQEKDGSFFIRYQWENAKSNHDSKYTTTNVIRFLIEIYKATGKSDYLNSALKAGEFSYSFIHNDYLYVGGVIDNPNVKDRESGQMAIYAFLALYDATRNNKWKDAAIQAARYTETFMFSYKVPMALNDSLTDFPKHRDIIGQTLIATGHSGIDNGLSFSSFQYYRLYLLTGDNHFLHVARIIQNNTLQIMDLDGKMGYRYRGLLTECFGAQANRGHSVRQQLPWNQAAVLEPMHRFMDAFGEWDIDIIEQWPLEKRLRMAEKYAETQGISYHGKK